MLQRRKQEKLEEGKVSQTFKFDSKDEWLHIVARRNHICVMSVPGKAASIIPKIPDSPTKSSRSVNWFSRTRIVDAPAGTTWGICLTSKQPEDVLLELYMNLIGMHDECVKGHDAEDPNEALELMKKCKEKGRPNENCKIVLENTPQKNEWVKKLEQKAADEMKYQDELFENMWNSFNDFVVKSAGMDPKKRDSQIALFFKKEG